MANFQLRRRWNANDLEGNPLANSYSKADLADNPDFARMAYLPDDVELFEWQFPEPTLPDPIMCVAYDALLPKGAVIVVHQIRHEDDADYYRWAHHIDDNTDGGVSHFAWTRPTGEASNQFTVDNGGFQSVVVPARIPVYIEAWLPIYQSETLVQVTQ